MGNESTAIYATGLIDEGMKFDAMKEELIELKRKISSKNPVCPICKKEMKQFNYVGYYDKFSGWDCECEYFDKVEKVKGSYA